ncbi:hypothetical protein pEaSNUABM11_00087 [Erwinia phage pEa_SNUABM_11]|nr:hypothetical protein pEaSNUABM11_00087 [Erwinia phage pEa_SNUABM_11]
MTKVFDFWHAFNAKYSFSEEDNLFVSYNEQYELGMRKLDNGWGVIGIDFEGTMVHEQLFPMHDKDPQSYLRAALEATAHAMLTILTGVWSAKDRDLYLRDLFTLVRQINNNLKDPEVEELLRRIKEPHDGVDHAPDGIYWNASKFIRKVYPDEMPTVQYTNGELVFIARPHYDGHQVEFLAMAFQGDVSLQARKMIGWTMEYEETLDELLTQFKGNVDKLGWKLFS